MCAKQLSAFRSSKRPCTHPTRGRGEAREEELARAPACGRRVRLGAEQGVNGGARACACVPVRERVSVLSCVVRGWLVSWCVRAAVRGLSVCVGVRDYAGSFSLWLVRACVRGWLTGAG